MNNEQQGQGQQNPGKVPPSTDKKEFKKDTKQQPTQADDEESDNGACASKGGSCGSGINKGDK
jgi:hypothetical protein